MAKLLLYITDYFSVPPKIHTLVNQTAVEGQSQTLVCLADGDPAPDMTFHKVGNELPYELGDDNVSVYMCIFMEI